MTTPAAVRRAHRDRVHRDLALRPRPSGMGEAAARAAWGLLLGRARTAAARALAGGAYSRIEAAEFDGLLKRDPPPFPARSISAANAAEAFMVLARGFAASLHPASTAPFLAAGAACLSRLLDEEAWAAAARTRAMQGEREDD
jgi:hypothetical protein